MEATKQIAQHYADAGCDIIEIDLPARDPFLEGPYIADCMHKALEMCGDYDRYMDTLVEIKEMLPDKRWILLVYENTILEIGYERFVEFCRKNGFTDLILVAPTHTQDRLICDGMGVSCYVQFQMQQEQIETARHSNGFVYMQSKPDAGKINPAYPALKDCIRHLREIGIERRVYCGVGIHTTEDAIVAKNAGADGIFVGSAILKLQNDIPAMKRTIREFKTAIEP